MDDLEYSEIEAAAKRQGETVSEWVRHMLREARASQPKLEASRKLGALRSCLAYQFPSGDIEQILEETDRGYLG